MTYSFEFRFLFTNLLRCEHTNPNPKKANAGETQTLKIQGNSLKHNQ